MTAPPRASAAPAPVPAGLALPACAAGTAGQLSGVRAGRELRARLAALGLLPGTPLTVVRAGGRGPVVVAVKGGGRIVLGRGMADRVYVLPRAP